ncbi:molybdenum cofactor guanylyltransferase MobA [Ferrimonas marina]|uniref:Molybdenum cofactor guanylyltransferase n=1 Tax=Ferrimonas marina TaxID=299255 RepID=A0A1M5XV91_9GAMM|nr:molybdenum cofactor guanylyltransferase MobA [Ferrimonas marina]SHI03755.1 molybdopterin-guanine dinucleotide biosynthesis protein A [Ferrimonas marina]
MKADTTLAILAGGRASRMDGKDKGLITVAGRPMVQHVLSRVRPEGMATLIIANRNQDAYRALGFPVFGDERADYPGPMAGMEVALQQAETPFVVVCPCDTPRLPPDLIERLHQTQQAQQADVVVANDGEWDHPVILLLKRELLPSMQAFLSSGERKIAVWYRQHTLARCTFSGQANDFANINTPEQCQQMEQALANNDPL